MTSTWLRSLASCDAPVLLCQGGSSVTALRTPMSDQDFFGLGGASVLGVLGRLVRGLPKSDLEVREAAWLDEIGGALGALRPGLNGGPSPFSFMDLRFLARVCLGRPIVDRGGLLARVQGLREPVRVALAAYLSSSYLATYEDVLGLDLAGRHQEVLPIAGELAQRAALLGLLQDALVDPSPKWALPAAVRSGDPATRDCALRLQALLGRFDEGAPGAWVRSLLASCNAIVAAGILRSLAGDRPRKKSHALSPAGIRHEWCLMGVPGYRTLLDLRTSRLLVWNPPWLHALVESTRGRVT
jgi:hypothetical protein